MRPWLWLALLVPCSGGIDPAESDRLARLVVELRLLEHLRAAPPTAVHAGAGEVVLLDRAPAICGRAGSCPLVLAKDVLLPLRLPRGGTTEFRVPAGADARLAASAFCLGQWRRGLGGAGHPLDACVSLLEGIARREAVRGVALTDAWMPRHHLRADCVAHLAAAADGPRWRHEPPPMAAWVAAALSAPRALAVNVVRVGGEERRVRLLTVGNRMTAGLALLCRSLWSAGMGFSVLGFGQHFDSTAQKLQWLLDLLDREAKGAGKAGGAGGAGGALAPDDDIVFVVDGFDSVVLAQPEELAHKFLAQNAPVVFSAEVACEDGVCGAPKAFPRAPAGGPFRFLNSGGFAGLAGPLRQLLRAVAPRASPLWDNDQRMLTAFMAANRASDGAQGGSGVRSGAAPSGASEPTQPTRQGARYWGGRVALDRECHLFQTLAHLRGGDFELVRGAGGLHWGDWNGPRIRSRLTGAVPAILHGNGATGKAVLAALVRELRGDWLGSGAAQDPSLAAAREIFLESFD